MKKISDTIEYKITNVLNDWTEYDADELADLVGEIKTVFEDEKRKSLIHAEATILRLGMVAGELSRRQNDQEASGIIQEIIEKWDELKAS